MNDDEIKQMQKEMEEEKANGVGLPVDISNQIMAQQMVGDIESKQQMDVQAHAAKVAPKPSNGPAKKPIKEEYAPSIVSRIKQVL